MWHTNVSSGDSEGTNNKMHEKPEKNQFIE